VADCGVVYLMAAELRVQSPLRVLWTLLTCAVWGPTTANANQSPLPWL